MRTMQQLEAADDDGRHDRGDRDRRHEHHHEGVVLAGRGLHGDRGQRLDDRRLDGLDADRQRRLVLDGRRVRVVRHRQTGVRGGAVSVGIRTQSRSAHRYPPEDDVEPNRSCWLWSG